jgi:hypothetical protein
LEGWTRERVPLDWATTQNNIGIALGILGERESGTEKLEDAVKAFREALKERTRERVPHEWTMNTRNQGVAMMRLAERKKDPVVAGTALQQIEAAFEATRAGEHAPNAAYFEARLAEARAAPRQAEGALNCATRCAGSLARLAFYGLRISARFMVSYRRH